MSSAAADLLAGASDPEAEAERARAPAQRVLARLEKTAIGRRRADGVTTVRRWERRGFFLYGPYWRLLAGHYRLEFHCRCGTPRFPSEPVLGVEVIAFNRVQRAWLDLTAAELDNHAGVLNFSVPPVLGLAAEYEARFEFRFFHTGNADLTISDVTLHGPEIAEQPFSPARSWRMLGRLETTVIAKRRAGQVTVRRADPPGCVLHTGQDLLQLPRGYYRLCFDCAAERERIATDPVLAVEVVAIRRWQDGRRQRPWIRPLLGWGNGGVALAGRDFTAAELHSGSGAVDFVVPTELALEGGQDVVISLRFLHLANADLRIDAIELREGDSPAGSAEPPMQWRLLGRLTKGSIGTRGPDGVTARSSEPPGRLLYGGRPHLPLPQGRYRLSLACRPGTPRSATEPVLAIEVIARSRRGFLRARSVQLRHDFTVDALIGGRLAAEFEVLPELGREHNGEVCFEFAILHLGNADLTVSAVDLHRISDGQEAFRSDAPSVIGHAGLNALLIGNCQAQTIYEALIRTGEFNRRLNLRYHFVGLQQNLHELGKAELQNSDVLLVQDIRDWQTYPLREHIRDGIRIVKFPLLHFASLWPFDHYNGPGDKEAYEREWPNLTFLYHDGLLARLRKEIPDPAQRLAAYRSLSVDGVVNFVRLHDFEKRRLIRMDKQFGMQIGAFILDNFTKRQLLYTTNHPNAAIMTMLIQYLLRQLETKEAFRPTAVLDHLNRLQVPVHPKVAEALGVKWANEHTKYRFGGEEITWETYVRRYIEHYG
jgi:hypothetical protein